MDRERAVYLDTLLDHFFHDRSIYELKLEDRSRYNKDLTMLIHLEFMTALEFEESDDYQELYITDKGGKFLLLGGFTKQHDELNKKLKADDLDQTTKKWSITNSKWSLVLSILAFIVSIIALFKDEIAKILFDK